MKEFKINKVAITSAIFVANLLAISAKAQLITSVSGSGSISGLSVTSLFNIQQVYNLNVSTNIISFINGNSYTLTFDLANLVGASGTINNIGLGQTIRLTNPSIFILGGLPPAYSLTTGAKSYTFTSTATASRQISFNFTDANPFRMSNLLLVDNTGNGGGSGGGSSGGSGSGGSGSGGGSSGSGGGSGSSGSGGGSGSSGSGGGSGSGSSESSTNNPAPQSIGRGSSFSLASVGSSGSLVFDGGTLQLASGNKSSQAFTINSTGGTIQHPLSGMANLSGALTGAGAITFTGSGTTVLSGLNTYSGGTTVASGTLSVTGSSPTGNGDVYVANSAMFMGTGNVGGSMTVSGLLKPGNSPGYLSIAGNLIMNSGSTYQQDIAGTSQANSNSPVGATGYYSFMNVGGQLNINGGTTLNPSLQNLFQLTESGYGSAPYVPNLGDQFRILTAVGGITGKFTTVNQPLGLATGTQFVSFYNMFNSNSLDLAVVPSSYATTISTGSGNKNAQSVGSVLDQITLANTSGSSTTIQDKLLYVISGQNTASNIASYAQSLSGEIYAAAVATIAQTTQRVHQAVLNRLGDTMGLGLSNSMTNADGNTALMNTTNTVLNGGLSSASVNSNPVVNSNTEMTSLTNGNVWGELAYQKGNRSSDSNSGGWNSNLYQLVFGSDFYSNQGIKVGGGIALSSTTLNPTYGSGTIQQGSVFGYGKVPVQEYVVDVMASFGLNSSNLSRNDISNLSSGFNNKKILGNDALVSLGVSRPMDVDQIRITPFARMTWQMLTQSSINEGDVASALSVNSFTGNGVRGVLGVAAGSKETNPMTEQYTYRAYVGVGADSNGLLNPNLTASLAGLNTNITTPNAGSTFVQAGLYGTAKVSDNAYAFAGLSGEARSGQTLGSVNVGLRVQF
jgi:autotransporter-associated beta strand protein